MKNNINITTYILYVEGMHCAACEIVIEKQLKKQDSINTVKASLATNKVTITGKIENIESFLLDVNKQLLSKGYKLTQERTEKNAMNWNELLFALAIAAIIASIFLILQKSGILNFVNATTISYPVVFLLGIVASLSSCMAVVGGLVLSLSSTYAKEEKKNRIKPQIIFHISRIIGFFTLGGIIGIIGSAFTLSPQVSFFLSLIVASVMTILGINLLNIFPFFKRLQLHMPKFLTNGIVEKQNTRNIFTPIFLGAGTFFLPCGFTQAMQIQALKSGTFVSGALTMVVFALGTLPVLSLISFTSLEFAKSKWSGMFFKVAGFIVIFFAIINLLAAFSAIGLINPLLNF